MIRTIAVVLTAGIIGATGAIAEEPANSTSDISKLTRNGPFKDVTTEQWQAIVTARMEQAVERLSLTDPQVEQIRPIVQEQVVQVRDLLPRFEDAVGRERFRVLREMMALREHTAAQVDDVLNDEQELIANEMREERRSKMRQAMQHYRAGNTDALRDLMLPELKDSPTEEN